MLTYIKRALGNYPFALLLSGALTLLLEYSGPNLDSKQVTLRIALSFAVMIPLSVSMRMMVENLSWKRYWGFISNTMLLLLFIAFFQWSGINYNSPQAPITFFLLFSLGITSTFTLPLLGHSRANIVSWEYIKRLTFHYIISIALALFVVISINLLLTFSESLFTNLSISSETFFRINAFILCFLLPYYIVAFFPQPKECTKEELPKLLRHIGLWVMLPVAALYATILFVYFVYLIVTHSALQGTILGPILIYFAILFTLIYALYPLVKSIARSPLFVLFSIGQFLFVGMGLWSILIRVNEYGITPPRYISMTMLIAILGFILLFLLRKRIPLQYHALLPFILFFISAIGPFNVFAVSLWSQTTIVQHILDNTNVLIDGTVHFENISTTEADKLRSALMSIVEQGGNTAQFNALVPNKENLYTALLDDTPSHSETTCIDISRAGIREGAIPSFAGYYIPKLYKGSREDHETISIPELNISDITLLSEEKSTYIAITQDNKTSRIDITPQLANIIGAADEPCSPIEKPSSEMMFNVTYKNFLLHVVVNGIMSYPSGNENKSQDDTTPDLYMGLFISAVE